ncbi:MAG: hypothetical protein Q8O76_02065 [Chloroflexota bacterium]|nr:hypothetical protein [Chloroflexota bacterium]
MPTKQRNIITLSDVPRELELWAIDETKRRRALGLPDYHFYQIFNDGLRLLKEQTRPGPTVYFLKDGRGPFYSTLEVLDALKVPKEKRGLYWHRHDRLPKEYADQIIVTPWKGDGAEAPATAKEEPASG